MENRVHITYNTYIGRYGFCVKIGDVLLDTGCIWHSKEEAIKAYQDTAKIAREYEWRDYEDFTIS